MSLYWFLSGNSKKPSSRIHGINISNGLFKRNIDSHIIYKPASSTTDIKSSKWRLILATLFINNRDTVIFQKLRGKNTVLFAKLLKKRGIRIVFVDCDFPLKIDISNKSDELIVTSNFLKIKYQEKLQDKKVHYLPDSIETVIKPSLKLTKSIIKGVWFGLPGESKWKSFIHIRRLLKSKRNIEIMSISSNEIADIKWDDKAYKTINGFDFCVIPMLYKGDQEYSKSSNRVLQAMALGVPVLASPVPSYIEVIKNGYNGFICYDDKDWLNACDEIQNLQKLNEMKINAFKFANNYFGINSILDKWEILLFPNGNKSINKLTRLLKILF